MEILKPISPMLAVYAAGSNVYEDVMGHHGNHTLAELKYDGYRMQLHKKGTTTKAFTRNMNEVPLNVYPELAASISNLPDCILDCELNGGVGHSGFKQVKRRFRFKPQDLEKYLKKVSTDIPLELKVFDTLYMEGQWLNDLPLSERRTYVERIEESRITPTQQWRVNEASRLETLFQQLASEKHEGLVCKNPGSFYVPGKRHNDWLKLKKFETLDLALLGVYMKDNKIMQFLCGSYNEDTSSFETLTKVNARRDNIGDRVAGMIELEEQRPSSVIISPNAKPAQLPDFYIKPDSSVVIEVMAMNIQRSKNWHSCGLQDKNAYSLRIAWAKQLREDKTPFQSTTTDRVIQMYNFQEETR